MLEAEMMKLGEQQTTGIPPPLELATVQTQALAYDVINLKTLYNKGQSLGELENLIDAIHLSKAAEACVDNDTVAEFPREAREALEQKEEKVSDTDGLIFEEITGEEAFALSLESEMGTSRSVVSSCVDNVSVDLQEPQDESIIPASGFQTSNLTDEYEYSRTLETLSQNPDIIRNMHDFLNSVNLESMVFVHGAQMNHNMVRLASDTVKDMQKDGVQNKIEMTSSFKKDQVLEATRKDMDLGQFSNTSMQSLGPIPEENEFSSASFSCMPSLSSDMEEHMRKEIENPAMIQMFSEMIKSMSPEMIASMSEQFGFKLTSDEAVQAQKTMSTLRPDDLNRMMRWAERAHRVAYQSQEFKKWILGRMCLILALFILILAIVLHKLGYIGH